MSQVVRRVANVARRGYSTVAAISDFDQQHKTPVIRKQEIIPIAEYGGRHAVTMLPGGGIGPELMGYVKEVFRLFISQYNKLSIVIDSLLCLSFLFQGCGGSYRL